MDRNHTNYRLRFEGEAKRLLKAAEDFIAKPLSLTNLNELKEKAKSFRDFLNER